MQESYLTRICFKAKFKDLEFKVKVKDLRIVTQGLQGPRNKDNITTCMNVWIYFLSIHIDFAIYFLNILFWFCAA